jgi:hypothetical protein
VLGTESISKSELTKSWFAKSSNNLELIFGEGTFISEKSWSIITGWERWDHWFFWGKLDLGSSGISSFDELVSIHLHFRFSKGSLAGVGFDPFLKP